MKTQAPARFLSFLLALPAVAGAREAFDLATFEPPPGWERYESPGQLTLRTPAGDGQVTLFESFATDAPAAGNFAAEWAKLITVPLGVAAPSPTAEESPEGWTAVLGTASVAAQDGEIGIVQVTATGFGRAMSVVALFAVGQRLADVTRFFDGLRFHGGEGGSPAETDADDEPVIAGPAGGTGSTGTAAVIEPAQVVDGRPVGIFWGFRVGTYGGARLELDTRTFFAGNRIARVFPFGGGDLLDTARCNPDTCGSYELSTGAMTVRWDDGQTRRYAYEATADGIKLDGTLFRPARPMSAAGLAGEWASGQAGGNPLSNVYRFEADGRFAFGAGGSSLSGRYAIERLTLVLRFEDGEESRRTLFSASREEPAGLIGVEGEVYARR